MNFGSVKFGAIGHFGCALCVGIGIAAGAQADPLSGRGAALGTLASAGTVPTATGGWLIDEPRATYTTTSARGYATTSARGYATTSARGYATTSVRQAERAPRTENPSGWSLDVHFVARFTQQREVGTGDALGPAAKVDRRGVAAMAKDIEDQMGGISVFPFGSLKYTFRF